MAVQPNEWKRGRQPRRDSLSWSSPSLLLNWHTLASRFLCVSGTPFGEPDDPDVKSRTASSSPPDLSILAKRAIMSTGNILDTITQRLIDFLMVGRIRSTCMRSLTGGQGKSLTFLTNGSAVINLSTSACAMLDLMASWLAVKFMLTGTLPAKMTARFAIRPPIPGGRMMATRFLLVCSFRCLAKASAIPSMTE